MFVEGKRKNESEVIDRRYSAELREIRLRPSLDGSRRALKHAFLRNEPELLKCIFLYINLYSRHLQRHNRISNSGSFFRFGMTFGAD